MAYLNKQQEVIKIQLTRLGKRLISKGNFKPSYYQFFDDDIVYDSQYAGFTEHQNAVQDRIKSGLTTEIQHTIIDIEEAHNIEMDKRKPPYFPVDSEYASDLVPANREAQLGTDAYFKELVQHNTVIEKEKLLQHPLSNMNVGARTLPRLNLTTFEAEINNSSSCHNIPYIRYFRYQLKLSIEKIQNCVLHLKSLLKKNLKLQIF